MKGLSQERCRPTQFPTTVANFPTCKLNRPSCHGVMRSAYSSRRICAPSSVGSKWRSIRDLAEKINVRADLRVEEERQPRVEQRRTSLRRSVPAPVDRRHRIPDRAFRSGGRELVVEGADRESLIESIEEILRPELARQRSNAARRMTAGEVSHGGSDDGRSRFRDPESHFELGPLVVRSDQAQIATMQSRKLAGEIQAESMSGNVLAHRRRDESARKCARARRPEWGGRCSRRSG